MPAMGRTWAGNCRRRVGSMALPMPGVGERLSWDSSTAGEAFAIPNEPSLMSSAPPVVMGIELLWCLSETVHVPAKGGTSIPFAL